MYYKVKEVANMVGVSVRMLHHYDKIGLLKPESVSPVGYRLYSDTDIERLQQILFLKELDFSLQDIKDIIYSPNFDREQALKTHKELLIKKKIRLEKIISTVEKTIQSIEGGIIMDKKDMFNGFDMTEIEEHKKKYAQETKERYGHTSAYKECDLKTSKYTKEDWKNISNKYDELYNQVANLMDKEPSNPEVQKVINEYRQFISDKFYNCTIDIFRGLGDLYIQDYRFTEKIDKYKPGLAKYLQVAIYYYCDNNQ